MKTQCPNCKSRFNVNETNIGKQAKCPKCTKTFTIQPFVEAPVAPVPAAAAPLVKSPEPAAIPPKPAEPASPPAKASEEVKPPAAVPVKGPEPAMPQIKSPPPAPPQAKIPAPTAPPAIMPEAAQQVKSKTNALSKTLFVYCWIAVRILAGVLAALGLMLAIKKGTNSTLMMAFAIADIFLIGSIAIEFMLFYKMWGAIKDSQSTISPGKAVGFLFIPVFNIYWALLMITGFAEDYNSFILRRSIKTGNLPMSLYLVYAFAFILTAAIVTVPMIFVFAFFGLIYRAYAGYPAAFWGLVVFLSISGLAHFITYILFAMKTCDAINALPGNAGKI